MGGHWCRSALALHRQAVLRMTLDALSQSTGIPTCTLSHFERGDLLPRGDWEKLAAAYQMSLVDLFKMILPTVRNERHRLVVEAYLAHHATQSVVQTPAPASQSA
jgi:hypothetical protein